MPIGHQLSKASPTLDEPDHPTSWVLTSHSCPSPSQKTWLKRAYRSTTNNCPDRIRDNIIAGREETNQIYRQQYCRTRWLFLSECELWTNLHAMVWGAEVVWTKRTRKCQDSNRTTSSLAMRKSVAIWSSQKIAPSQLFLASSCLRPRVTS